MSSFPLDLNIPQLLQWSYVHNRLNDYDVIHRLQYLQFCNLYGTGDEWDSFYNCFKSSQELDTFIKTNCFRCDNRTRARFVELRSQEQALRYICQFTSREELLAFALGHNLGNHPKVLDRLRLIEINHNIQNEFANTCRRVLSTINSIEELELFLLYTGLRGDIHVNEKRQQLLQNRLFNAVGLFSNNVFKCWFCQQTFNNGNQFGVHVRSHVPSLMNNSQGNVAPSFTPTRKRRKSVGHGLCRIEYSCLLFKLAFY